MKKLIVNGCSFIAGDAIVWDQFLKEKKIDYLPWEDTYQKNPTPEILELQQDYKLNFRKNKNLPKLLGDLLNSEVVDLSIDGNSNDNIALSTINYLINIPKTKRNNYHILIGWTALSRGLKYVQTLQSFFNLNYFCVPLIFYEELNKYAKSIASNTYDEDYYLNYLKNVIMLENFLKENHCTYTFYRNLGDSISYDFFNLENYSLSNINKYSDDNCWFKFSNNDTFGLNGSTFLNEYTNKNIEYCISATNGHPNLKIISIFADKLANFIRNQNVGF